MTEIDKFLAEFENKYNPKRELLSNNNISSNYPDTGTKIDAFLGDVMKDFSEKKVNSNQINNQDLFTDIKERFSEPKSTHNSQDKINQNQDLFADIKAKFHPNESIKKDICQGKLDNSFVEVESKFIPKNKEKKQLNDSKLKEIEAKYQVKKVQSQVNKPLNIEAIKEEELQKQRRKKALIKQAEIWLKNLDPYSDEGFWFEQFSLGYNSKLEAAIDYLDALNN